MNQTLYVVTSLFNPQQFRSRARLYRKFAAHMAASGVELCTVEAAFGDHPFEVTAADNPMNLQLRTDQVLWHKERLINLGIARVRHLVPDARFFGWFDADTTFANADWAAETVHKLMTHCVIQPFSEGINLNANEEMMWACPSSFRSFLEGRGYHQRPAIAPAYIYKGHPGLAWAATREALDSLGGLYDVCAGGSGDTIMSNCLKGGWDTYLPVAHDSQLGMSIKRWAARCDKYIRGNIGFTRGALLHHWHGPSEKRGYEKRWDVLAFHEFDPVEDLITEASGLSRWAGNKPQLEDDIRLSLSARSEDEV